MPHPRRSLRPVALAAAAVLPQLGPPDALAVLASRRGRPRA